MEYKFCLCDAEGNVTGALRGWSRDATVTYAVPAAAEGGGVAVRVDARQVGSDEDYERYCVWSPSQ